MEETKKNKRSKRTIILTVVIMAAVFLFLVYLNQRPYAHVEVQALSDLNAQQIVQKAASKMRLEPEELRVTPSGKVTFDVDETGKLVRPLQFDLHGVSGENVQTATLLFRKPGLYLYRNQTEKLPKNYTELPEYTQDFDLTTFLSALHALPITQAAKLTGGETVLSTQWNGFMTLPHWKRLRHSSGKMAKCGNSKAPLKEQTGSSSAFSPSRPTLGT